MVMAKIDLKFVKGDRTLAKKMGNTYTAKKKPSKKKTTTKKKK